MSMRRPLLAPLVPVYGAGLRVKDALYGAGVFKQKRLQAPVISVGSVSAGGAGKTPVVLLLVRLLAEQGYAPDILTRGYGRKGTETERVDPAAKGAARRYGDEAVLLAGQAAVPVYVASQRHNAGLMAEVDHPARHARRIHLLDDGLQHRQLARSVDLVLLTAEDLDDHLIPAGNLREPWQGVLRDTATPKILVLRAEEAGAIQRRLEHAADGKPLPPVWLIRRRLEVTPAMRGEPLFAFSGIARPDSFTGLLSEEGVSVAGHRVFPDHHVFTDDDILSIQSEGLLAAAQGFITTAKDAVRLTPAQRATLEEIGPIHVPPLTVSLKDEAAALSQLRALLEAR